jgi:NAD(P)H:quinone oxidoreductase type IV
VTAGVREAGADAQIYQVLEPVPDEVLERVGAPRAARRTFAHLPVAKSEQMTEADAIIFGTPTRFGNMCAQMRNLLDQTSRLWLKGSLVGKVGSVFTSTATQHGGQETTVTSFHTTLLHHGVIIVGVPCTDSGLVYMDDITGGTPHGASTLTKGEGSRQPTANELKIARFRDGGWRKSPLNLPAKPDISDQADFASSGENRSSC